MPPAPAPESSPRRRQLVRALRLAGWVLFAGFFAGMALAGAARIPGPLVLGDGVAALLALLASAALGPRPRT